MRASIRPLPAAAVLAAGMQWLGWVLPAAAVDATGGAAPGYVADRECAACHSGHYADFQDVGMARSFGRAENAQSIEDFDAAPYHHEPSGRFYQVTREGGELWFRRFQLDAEGERINELALRIDWILGSGNRARSYLVQFESGQLYQLPIGWYSQIGAWRMSPGFDRADHLGPQREVKRECMFCHNAYPEVPAGSDAAFRPHTFPEDLPEGIGCQRCHGPGAKHVARVGEGGSLEAIREAIVHPGKLPPARRDEVCFQCHMLPEVALIGPRSFGRGSYSFRPGQTLSDYIRHLEVEIEGVSREENFQINHHAYRMIQSECFRQSEGELTCTSCHDPHHKPASPDFRRRVDGVCSDCHAAPQHADDQARDGDCAGCHMPERRTRDVIHATMTDHLIASGPFDADALLAPLEESTPTILDAELLDRDNLPDEPLPEIYKAVATLQAGGSNAALDYLEGTLPSLDDPPLEAVMWMARSQIDGGRLEHAHVTLNYLAKRDAPQWFLDKYRGLALLRQSRHAEAVAPLRRAVEALPDAPDIRYQLGRALWRSGEADAGREAIRRSLQLLPMNPEGWVSLGLLEAERGDEEAAIAAMKRALAYEPTHTGAYIGLIRLLEKTGKNTEAERYRRHGLDVADQPDRLLGAIDDGPTDPTR